MTKYYQLGDLKSGKILEAGSSSWSHWQVPILPGLQMGAFYWPSSLENLYLFIRTLDLLGWGSLEDSISP